MSINHLREATMEQASTIGLDIAKRIFQAHGADTSGQVMFRKRLTRAKVIAFFAARPLHPPRSEDEDIARERISGQCLAHQRRQGVHPLAEVDRLRRHRDLQPWPDWDPADHPRRPR